MYHVRGLTSVSKPSLDLPARVDPKAMERRSQVHQQPPFEEVARVQAVFGGENLGNERLDFRSNSENSKSGPLQKLLTPPYLDRPS